MTVTPQALGSEIRRARKALYLSQELLAERAGLNLATIAGLEAGRGTVASLHAVLDAIGRTFSWHYCTDLTLGQFLGTRREKMRLSMTRLAAISGVARPSIVQIEADRGHIATLCAVLDALNLPPKFSLRHSAAQDTCRIGEVPRAAVQQVIERNCRDIMDALEPGSVDLVLTSPPYNTGKSYEPNLSEDEYRAFAEEWTSRLPRVMSATGSLWLNVGFMMLPGGEMLPLTYLYYPILKKLGFALKQEIVWHYRGGMRYSRRFAVRSERWMWWVRDLDRHQFHVNELRDPLANLTRDKRNSPLGKTPEDVWRWNRVVGGAGRGEDKTSHPCQFPVEMIETILLACSRPGDVVLDPFAGSGTTGAACMRRGRGYIMIEQDAGYVMETRERLSREAEAVLISVVAKDDVDDRTAPNEASSTRTMDILRCAAE